MTHAPATITDLFELLIRRHMAAERRVRMLERALRRVLQDEDDIGGLSPHTLRYLRQLLRGGEDG